VSEASRSRFDVVGRSEASSFADAAIEIRIDDPAGRLGRRPAVLLDRGDADLPVLRRPLLLGADGRGRFLGWVPECGAAISLEAGPEGSATGTEPQLRIRRLGPIGLCLEVLAHRPLGLVPVLRLAAGGNRRGARFRFARLIDAIAAPVWADWWPVQTADDIAAATALDLSGAPRLLFAIEPGAATAQSATRADILAETGLVVHEVEPDDRAVRREAAAGDLFLRLPAGARLTPGALRHLVAPFLVADPPLVTIADEDRLDARGRRCDPAFKPVWDPLAIAAGAVTTTGAVVRLAAVPAEVDLCAGSIEAVVLATIGERRDAVVHLPRLLVHRPGERPVPRLLPVERPATAERPAISVVIPTRDRADLLSACLDGLARRTVGVDLETIVVDNDSREPATAALLAAHRSDPGFRVIAAPGPFDFARLADLGVAAAGRDLVLLLNNDVEPLAPDWLAAMVAEIAAPDVGAVGALLLYPDGSVQHAGVDLGIGTVASHAFRFLFPAGGEDRGQSAVRRETSAVTAACLLTRRSFWYAVGGMEERGLAVAFNDVDYCLKLRARGLRVVVTPEARLVHRESMTRGGFDDLEKKRRFAREEALMQARWGRVIANDPFGNPNRSRVGEAFVLAAAADLAPRRSS
jgi:GT2 family glycosyltransferase